MATKKATDGATTRGGRGARERILRAAVELFPNDGIHVTGIAKLADAAHVSTRTLYQHFPSKEALISAYLERIGADSAILGETVLERRDLSARERLLRLFSEHPAGSASARVVRGCPLHNAAVESAGTLPEASAAVERHKREFIARLVETAAEAGASQPETLGRQLAVLFEGARALATSLNDLRPFEDAKELAIALIQRATEPTTSLTQPR
ncbi:TetR/AcrR family transcriptional regulator [Mycolicibacterium brisbanense]|uniref:TetR family transcriptional regulator n=1 Tax=Mycolicibacterium brisbanense TaxID=146020 RepID=A0A100VWV7_9MYCO|nr:TetR/AcrR family transcriptional regulator [Mycolicibacterium brisbanense]MCV7161553.1 TetR/AcrR family transcriptional regulator [Mycolicibacterium brisbanense]GAS87473.1 TetR family transcriptional regulator [Mycolicibacterium brisbanense]